jgi:hypothetical protein
MFFPTFLWSISFVLAIIAMVLSVASEVLSPNSGRDRVVNIKIRKLEKAAFAFTILFVATIALRAIDIILAG